MKAAAFEYERPRSCAEAARLLHQSAGRGKVISGGQSLGAMMNLRLAQPELLVDVRAIDALQRCEIEADAVWLGDVYKRQASVYAVGHWEPAGVVCAGKPPWSFRAIDGAVRNGS